MSINNKVASLLEEKLYNYIEKCVPSDEITSKFMTVLDSISEYKAMIIKMRYGLNEQEYKYKWQEILDKINEENEYKRSMHHIKDMESKAWQSIKGALTISEFRIKCADLYKAINKDGAV
jgi:DNA-directed RNA polymerase sigma subunit (sigma70/sigma32)